MAAIGFKVEKLRKKYVSRLAVSGLVDVKLLEFLGAFPSSNHHFRDLGLRPGGVSWTFFYHDVT